MLLLPCLLAASTVFARLNSPVVGQHMDDDATGGFEKLQFLMTQVRAGTGPLTLSLLLAHGAATTVGSNYHQQLAHKICDSTT